MSVSWRSHMRWAVAGILLLALLVSLGPGPGAHAERVNQQTSSSESAATSHLVTAIVLDPPSPNTLSLNQNVNLTFNYQTTEPGGVRIFARPFTGGALSPDYAAHGSPVYPTGSGAGTGSFTISSGAVVVDHIRIQMYNDDQSTLLFEAFLPVYYRFAEATHIVSHVVLSPDTPNVLDHNQDVNLTFNYQTTEPGGVRIFARPFTGSALSPNYAAHASPVYPTGSGAGTGSFTISSGAVVVDHIRIQMYNDDQSTLLFEAFLPVYYRFAEATHIVSHVVLSPDTPNVLDHNQDVNLTFNYQTTEPGGVRIFARPFTGGALSPNYAAHASPLYPTGSGAGTGSFTISSGPVIVDQVRVQMYNDDQSTLLFEAFLPVYYQFGQVYQVYLPYISKGP